MVAKGYNGTGRLPTEEEIVEMSAERRWYWTHLEEGRRKAAEKQKKRAPEIKIKVLEMLGGSVCINCGCDDIVVLEVNHKDGDKSNDVYHENEGSRTSWIYSDILAGRRKTEDLNVLCRVCNNKEWAERKSPKSKGRWKVVWV